MAVRYQKRAVGVFPNRNDAERALHELRDSNFPMERVSVIAKDQRSDRPLSADVETEKAGNKADEGAAVGAATGGAIGTITGLLVGLGALAIPGIGPVMLAGATATALASTLSGAAIGAAAGGLVGALVGLGIPEERAKIYNERVAQGDYLIIVEGTDDEIRHAERILHDRGIQEWGIYETPESHDRVHHQNEVVHRRETVVEEQPVVERERDVVRTEGDVVYKDDVVKVIDHTQHREHRR